MKFGSRVYFCAIPEQAKSLWVRVRARPNSQAPSASISMYHVSGHLPYMYVFCLMNKSVKEG